MKPRIGSRFCCAANVVTASEAREGAVASRSASVQLTALTGLADHSEDRKASETG